MEHLERILGAHPAELSIDRVALASAARDLADCATTCVVCADACLSESNVSELAQCISFNLDCAEECGTTLSLLGRIGHPQTDLLQTQVEACRTACRSCAQECERHSGMHEHCRICAESCRACERACEQLLQMLGRLPVGAFA